MDEVETIHIRGENGLVMAHDLPLGEGIAHRLEAGHLVRVNEDGTPWEAPADAEVDPAAGVVSTTKPDPKASKAAWVGWAVLQGMTPDDAEAATKADLVDKYGN